MTSLDLLQPHLTDEIKALAIERITGNRNLGTRKDLKRAIIKLVLILVREINPLEVLSRDETAILMGINKETVRKLNQEKRFVHVVNH
jgi:hypothetical protein